MKKRFWDDPYLTRLNTKITHVNGNEVLFDETIIFSFSGGQESDKAWINGLPVLNSKIVDKLIYYTLPDNHGLQAGDEILMEIDWPRRLKLMRLHFAAELVLEIVTQKYHLEKVGAHISENKARIDFMSEENISTKFPEILTVYNQIIENNLPIIKDFSDEANQRRFWKIEGFAEVPCGGTHVASTSEVGYVNLKRSHPGKSLERIEITLVKENP